jgi:hypothetical protein
MQLDYRTLSEPVTDAQIRQYASKDIAWVNRPTMTIAGILLWILFTGPLVAGTLTAGRGVTQGAVVTFIFLTVIAWGTVWAATIGAKLQARRTVRLKRFAQSNGAVLAQNVMSPGIRGMIFDNGHTRTLEESIAFDGGVELGNYYYVTGSGKNRSVHRYNFARIALNRNLPHMVLDAKSNNFLGSNLPDRFNGGQRMSLEGDFDKYFTVYAPEGYERDALYVFTPDVMQVLVDQGKDFDIEIVGSELFIFRSGKLELTSKIELEKMLAVVNSISGELKDQSKRYIDERSNSRSTIAGGVVPQVAAEGQRLRRSSPVVPLTLLSAVIAAVILPSLLPDSVADPFVLIAWPAIIWGLIVYGVVNYIRTRK